MGLDISAYSNMKIVENPELDEDGYYNGDGVQIWVNFHFPGREGSFIHNAVYDYDDYFGFRAGSYGGYNNWRGNLAVLAGLPTINGQPDWENLPEEGPFIELINFSDCEGVLGTDVCRKLLKDFEEYNTIASQTKFDDGYWYSKYQEWRKAFQLASNDGAVAFH